MSQAVVDEAERAGAVAANAVSHNWAMKDAQKLAGVPQVQLRDVAAESNANAAPAPGRPLWQSGGRRLGEISLGKHSTFASDGPADSKFANPHDPARAETKKWGKTVEFFEREEGIRGQEPRQRFAETAYWNPLVVTGKDGKVRITFKAPTAMSAYRITARGVTGADTLAGQTTSSLTVRKNFFVDLKLPSSLTQGDKPRFIAGTPY